MKGRLITFEGGEGAGKTTAISVAAGYLHQQGITTQITREPGGSAIAEHIRSMLLDPDNTGLHAETELLLMFAARAQNLADTIRPAIENGIWVLCDRYTDASRAYQGAGRGIAKKHIEYLADWIHGDMNPDLTVLLDIDVATGMARVTRRGAQDRMEQAEMEFYQRVREAYRKLASNDPRFRIVDASADLKAVGEAVIRHLGELLQESNHDDVPGEPRRLDSRP